MYAVEYNSEIGDAIQGMIRDTINLEMELTLLFC
jgi:hypothetical protein